MVEGGRCSPESTGLLAAWLCPPVDARSLMPPGDQPCSSGVTVGIKNTFLFLWSGSFVEGNNTTAGGWAHFDATCVEAAAISSPGWGHSEAAARPEPRKTRGLSADLKFGGISSSALRGFVSVFLVCLFFKSQMCEQKVEWIILRAFGWKFGTEWPTFGRAQTKM